MELQHKRKDKYNFSKASIQFDGRVRKYPVDDNGVINVANEAQAKALERTDKWTRVDKDESAPYALKKLTVDEVDEYLEDIDSIDRLKELRGLEGDGKNRKNALQSIDDRIHEVKEAEKQEAKNETENEDEENVEQGETENGTENEERKR